MFEINLLRGYYTGSNIKIALIDTGIKRIEYNLSTYDIKRFYYNPSKNDIEENIDSNILITDNHGSFCGMYILDVAPKVSLLDININTESTGIHEEAIIKAIEFSIENKVDLINISLGLPFYSMKLHEVCKRAYENNIIILGASAHGNELAFPSDDEYVVKIIDGDYVGEENIEKMGVGTYEVKYKVISICTYRDTENKIVDVEKAGGSSMACAYVAGILALYLESRPLMDKKSIINKLFSSINSDISDVKEDKNKHIEIKENSLYSVISSYYADYMRYKDITNKNIVGYYDLIEKEIKYFKDSKEEHKGLSELYVINPLHYQRIHIESQEVQEQFKKIHYIGDFESGGAYRGKNIEKIGNMREIDTPIILIVGAGMDCGKFNVQLEMKKHMTEYGLLNYNITYNALGNIFNMDVLEYPSDMCMNDIIYSINNYVKKVEDDFTGEYESIIIDVAGGMFPLSRVNSNNFGMLYQAYLNALIVDYLIMCVNYTIDIRVVEREIKKVNLLGIDDIAIVMSDLSYNNNTWNSARGIVTYVEEEENIKKAILEYKEYFAGYDHITIYGFNDVKAGNLYHNMMNKMTSE